jgi:5-methyltetrahydropteroyltriglutamate--homocysteine methyltransferase
MVQSYDVGSFPFFGDLEKFVEGAKSFEKNSINDRSNYFEKTIVDIFLDKLAAGIDVANFPQLRDMNEMFLSMFAGVERLGVGYVETSPLALEPADGHLPEVSAIRKNAGIISERCGHPFVLKLCVTGPHTLASLFPYRTGEIFSRLGKALSRVVKANVFDGKFCRVGIVSVDEPVFGLVDDPLVDRGSPGRDSLLKAWDEIFRSAKAKRAKTCLHLHSTSDSLFWGVQSLDIVESHVGDSIYGLSETKRFLEEEDKVLKASACIVDFDELVRKGVADASRGGLNDLGVNEAVAATWERLREGAVNADSFLESSDVMRRRIVEVVKRFGVERVPYAGPECGLRGFPSHECAVECLKRVSAAARSLEGQSRAS